MYIDGAAYGLAIGIVRCFYWIPYPAAYSNGVPAAILIFAFLPLGSWIESNAHQQPQLVPITTSIIIDRSKQEVWSQLVAFNDMVEPTEWIFRSGIAFPVRAVIEGKGVAVSGVASSQPVILLNP